MSTATTDPATLDADRYLKEVAPYLAALPADERADLLDDLAQHLREIAAEPGPPLAERLGPPDAYAAELLASAGVAAAEPVRTPLAARAVALIDRVRSSWIGAETVRLVPVLRPAWWVLRAYLAVSLLASGSGQGLGLPRLAGNPALGLLGVLVAVPLSVRLGQRALPRAGRMAVVAANIALAIYGLSLLAGSGTAPIRYVDSYGGGPSALSGCLAGGSGDLITNLYAYDAEGRLLDPVLLYDQDGRPIDNLCPEFDGRGRRLTTEYRQDVNGAPVINAFPRRQTASAEPERGPYSRPGALARPEITVPVRPPAVVVPRLATTTTAPTPTTAVPG